MNDFDRRRKQDKNIPSSNLDFCQEDEYEWATSENIIKIVARHAQRAEKIRQWEKGGEARYITGTESIRKRIQTAKKISGINASQTIHLDIEE